MGSAALGIAAIVLVVGCFLGWHANRAHAAHGDIKVTHNRISGYRKTRLRSGLIMLGLVVVALLAVSALFRH
jgi:divalent metal cation (Fe/Co/Zn/Cd) transporter